MQQSLKRSVSARDAILSSSCRNGQFKGLLFTCLKS